MIQYYSFFRLNVSFAFLQGALQDLRLLVLDFSGCSALGGIADLGRSVGAAPPPECIEGRPGCRERRAPGRTVPECTTAGRDVAYC